jgi:hypothetical protein
MQVSNFRYILDIPGQQLTDASALMYELADELDNVTYTNVKKIVLDEIESVKLIVAKNKTTRHNLSVIEKMAKANAKIQKVHDKKMASIGKHRNLSAVNK